MKTLREWAETIEIRNLEVEVRSMGAVAVSKTVLGMTVRDLLRDLLLSGANDAIIEMDFGEVKITLDMHAAWEHKTSDRAE